MSELQESVLQLIQASPDGILQWQIRDTLGMDGHAVSMVVRSLQAHGLIEKTKEKAQNRWRARA